ncbi:MAG: TldD/PmbA family protein [Turicibacter sp.]|nr:TldD/PmbA family protein [Turicibacter sp.]
MDNFNSLEDRAAAIIEKVTSYTKYYGVVNIHGGTQNVCRFANSQITQNTNNSDWNVSLTLHDGKKQASGTSNVLSDEGLKKLANDVENLLLAAPSGEHDIFPWSYPFIEQTETDKDLAVFYSTNGCADAIKKGVELLDSDTTAAGALTLERKIAAYGNSGTSSLLFSALDNVQFNTVVTGPDGAAGSGDCISHRLNGVDIQGAFQRAKERSQMARNAVAIDNEEYTVVLTPQALANLLLFVTWSLNAKRVSDGLSFCSGDLKNTSFPKYIKIYDDVHHDKVFPLYFDFEGNQRSVIPLIENGSAQNILFDNKTAALAGKRTTGHAVSNEGYGGYSLHTVMAGGDSSPADMIASVKRGLFISEFHYTNFVNPSKLQVTGLTRNGTYLIENGKIVRAVKNMRFNQNLVEALNNIVALSQEVEVVDTMGGWANVVPYALAERFNFK